MRSQKPAFEQGGHPMHPWQQFCGGIDRLALDFADRVIIPQPIQPLIRLPTIGMNRTPGRNGSLDKPMEVYRRAVRYPRQTDATDARPEFFGRDNHQGFTVTTPAFLSRRYTPHLRFIHFDTPAEPVPPGTHHGPAQFVEQGPSRLITTQAQNALQAQRTGSVLLTGQIPHRSQPQPQGQMAVLKHGASGHGRGVLATGTHQPPTSRWPAFLPTTPGTNEAVRPTQAGQVGAALFL